jgi:hypothetical protein
VYALFMKAHKCYDLIPTSTKLVVFDTQLPVCRHAFVISSSSVRLIAQALVVFATSLSVLGPHSSSHTSGYTTRNWWFCWGLDSSLVCRTGCREDGDCD